MGQLAQLGDSCVTMPQHLAPFLHLDIVHISGNQFNTAVVTADGEVHMLGSNLNGQLGIKAPAAADGTPQDARVPVRVTALDLHRIVHVACGQNHVLAVTDQGWLASWGASEWGQLGSGAEGSDQPTPKILKAVRDNHFVRVAAGACHSLALTSNGQVFSFGQGTFGALGHHDHDNRSTPCLVEPLWAAGVTQVSCGENHSAALCADGRLFTWGRGKYGQLGHGDFASLNTPTLLRALHNRALGTQVACGGDHMLLLDSAGSVWSWGRATCGQTGQGAVGNTCRPQRIQALDGQRVVLVSAGCNHSAVLTSAGDVFTFGAGEQHQLGLAPAPPPACIAASESQSGLLSGSALADAVGPSQPAPPPPRLAVSPQLVISLPNLAAMFLVALGDHTMAVLKVPGGTGGSGGSSSDANGGCATMHPTSGTLGASVSDGSTAADIVGVHLSRPHGLGLVPLQIPPLGLLAEEVANSRTAGVRGAGGSPGALALCRAVDDVFSAPGYLISGFTLPSAPARSRSRRIPSLSTLDDPSTADPAEPDAPSSPLPSGRGMPTVAPHLSGMPSHRLDINAIGFVYESLLRLYSSEVVSALGGACIKLLSRLENLLISGYTSDKASDHARGSHGEFSPHRPSQGAASNGGSNGDDSAPGDARSTTGGTASSTGSTSAAASPLECLRALMILFMNPLNSESTGLGSLLCSKLISVLLALPMAAAFAAPGGGGSGGGAGGAAGLTRAEAAVAQRTLADWLAGLPGGLFGGRVVRPLQRHVTKLTQGPGGFAAVRDEVLRATAVLELLHAANARLPASAALPFSEFHNMAVSESANLKEEYLMWVQSDRRDRRGGSAVTVPANVCAVPFILTPDAKCRILQGEANLQKQHQVQTSAINAYFSGQDMNVAAHLGIEVRRSHLLQDTLAQIVARPRDLKKPLRVTFISNGVAEEGQDEGGVSREFFQLLVTEIFRPEYGMFEYSDETRSYWFNHASLETQIEFQLVGMVLGLAIYNNVILNVHLPPLVYKKLLGATPQFPEDLGQVFPDLTRGLTQLLQFEGDVEATFCRTFEVESEFYGEVRRQELIPGGSRLAVTAANRQLFVEVYTKHLLTDSIAQQFNAFAHGFHQVCGGPALRLFRHEELELLVCGLPHLDFEELERAARYEGGYHGHHPTVRLLWAVLHAADVPTKKRFLMFTTGCDRAPVAGLGRLTLTVQRGGPDSDRLPSAHTCFNVLLLPDYSSLDKLRERLFLAMEHGQQGFGLK